MIRVRRSTAEPRMELTPLMDMMFLLLTFFIFAFALIVRLKVTDVQLPAASGGKEVKRGGALVVALRADGSLALNDEPAQRETLVDQLAQRLEEQPESTLFIATDEKAPSGELFKLMDTLQAAGFADLRFLRLPQAEPPEKAVSAPSPPVGP